MIWETFFDKDVEIQRLKAIVGTDNEEYQMHLPSVRCNIQSLDDSPAEDLEGSVGQDFLMFCGDVDIKIHDKVIDGEDNYKVIGREENDFAGYKNLELRIRRTL